MQKKLRIPIVFKLVTITILLLMAATISIMTKSGEALREKLGLREADTSQSQAVIIAESVQTTILGLVDKSKVVANILYRNTSTEAEREAALDLAFRNDKDLVAVEVYVMKDGHPVQLRRTVNEAYLKQYELKSDYIEALRQSRPFPLPVVFAGEVEIRNSSVEGGAPLITVGVPFVKDDMGQIEAVLLADVRLDRIQKLFSSNSERVTYLIDREGRLLAHPDEKLALTGKKLAGNAVVDKVLASKATQGRNTYQDEETEESFIAAYAKTPFGVSVISQIPESTILELPTQIQRMGIKVTGIVVSIALFFIFLFSTSLTRPLEKLVHVTEEIAKGNFNVRAKVMTRDEVGELANAFDNMVIGLIERDKAKDLLNKFQDSDIAEMLMAGELKLGGEKRTVTVFFSDIRGFTAFSEKVEPEEVVKMLNDYFKVMVSLVKVHKGVVNKFIGDAIMAMWGAPKSYGQDEISALKCCLEMRVALEKFNDERITRGQPEIKMGIGIHTGPLIAGQIGTDDRMEYTVIGDTVNLASRIESATKAYGTDLLISEATYELVKSHFACEVAGQAVVKGKDEPLKFFKVTGYIDEQGQTIEVKTRYSSYEAEHAEKIKTA